MVAPEMGAVKKFFAVPGLLIPVLIFSFTNTGSAFSLSRSRFKLVKTRIEIE